MNVFGDNVQITGQLFIHVQSDLLISKSSISVESYQQIKKKWKRRKPHTNFIYYRSKIYEDIYFEMEGSLAEKKSTIFINSVR